MMKQKSYQSEFEMCLDFSILKTFNLEEEEIRKRKAVPEPMSDR